MPLYMDIHELGHVTAEDLARAHAADLKTQEKYGVEYLKYWCNESCGKVFCLVNAPDPESARRVHREAHGFEAEKLIEVQPEIAEGFLGGTEVNQFGAVLLPGGKPDERDPGIRTVLFTDIVGSTALTQELGDEDAMELVHLHDKIVRAALESSDGREVKTPATGSWPHSSRPRPRSNARPRFNATSRNTARLRPALRSKFALASLPANRSNITTIFLARPCSWQRGSALAPSPTRLWFRMWWPSCALAKSFASKIWVDSNSRASTNQSMRTRWRGSKPPAAS